MRSLAAFLLAMILVMPIVPASQAQEKSPQEKTECGTVIPPEQLKAELAREAIAARETPPPTHAPHYLPLTIHFVHRSNGTGGFTLDQLEVAMRDLNRIQHRPLLAGEQNC